MAFWPWSRGQTTYLLCGTWLILFDTHAFFHGVSYGVSWTAELISRPTFQQHLREKTEDPQVLAKAARVGGNLGGHRHCPFQPYGGRAAPSFERAGVSCHLGGGGGIIAPTRSSMCNVCSSVAFCRLKTLGSGLPKLKAKVLGTQQPPLREASKN